MNKTATLTANARVPAQSDARSIRIDTGTPVPSTSVATPPAPTASAATNSKLPQIRYAAAVLNGQPHMLEAVASCFASDIARIKKHAEEGWILESVEFASCTSGEQVFPIADDVVSRVHRILALYCGADDSLSVGHIYWINAEGESLRSIRGTLPVNVISSTGIAELQGASGGRPLGSAVLQAMIRDSRVNEALALHGESGLSWSQVYDIIEFIGRKAGTAKTGYANRKQIGPVRQTANHYRHPGSPKAYPLPANPPALAEASEFARTLLKRWIASRL
jgi:hypothetical protein